MLIDASMNVCKRTKCALIRNKLMGQLSSSDSRDGEDTGVQGDWRRKNKCPVLEVGWLCTGRVICSCLAWPSIYFLSNAVGAPIATLPPTTIISDFGGRVTPPSAFDGRVIPLSAFDGPVAPSESLLSPYSTPLALGTWLYAPHLLLRPSLTCLVAFLRPGLHVGRNLSRSCCSLVTCGRVILPCNIHL